MSKFIPEQDKINKEIALENNLELKDVERVLDLYWKGIASKIKIDEPAVHIIPYLGKFTTNKRGLKKFKEIIVSDEVNHT